MDSDQSAFVQAVFYDLMQMFPNALGNAKINATHLHTNVRYRLFTSQVDKQIDHEGSHFRGYIFHEVVIDHLRYEGRTTLVYKISSVYEDTGIFHSVVYPVSEPVSQYTELDPADGVDVAVARIAHSIQLSLVSNAQAVQDVPSDSFIHACYWHAVRVFNRSLTGTNFT